MTAVSSQPTITKTYDVELSLGKAATKRIPYRNPWNRPKSFGLVSSDENVLRPRDGGARVTIPPNGVEYLRLYFPAVHRRGMLPYLKQTIFHNYLTLQNKTANVLGIDRKYYP